MIRQTISRVASFPINRSQIGTVLLVMALLVSLIAAPVAADLHDDRPREIGDVTTVDSDSASLTAMQDSENVSYYEDFEDGDYNDWSAEDDSIVSVVADGFYGDQSLEVTDDTTNQGGVRWTDGPRFDTGDNFEISGTVKPSGTGGDADPPTVRVGIMDDNWEEQAMIFMNYEQNATYLQTHYTQDVPEDRIETDFRDEWVDFRLQFDGGVARAKVWAAGTSEPSDWQLEREFNQFEGDFAVQAGNQQNDRQIYVDQVDAGGHTISGQVTDQNGDPVPNATVDLVGADYDSLEEQADDLDAEADEILREIETIEPDEWDPNYDPADHADATDTEYVLVHESHDWDPGIGVAAEYVVPGVDSSIDDPRLTVGSDRDIMLSIWDPDASRSHVQDTNQIDASYPGNAVSGTVVVEQLGPHGEVMDSRELETEVVATTTAGRITGENEHEAVVTKLPPGIYRAYPEGNEAGGYVFSVGDADELFHGWQEDLRDEHDQLTQHSEKLNDRIESGDLSRTTTTTDENGYYEIHVPTGVEKATVIAYGDYGDQLDDVTGPSLADLQALQDEEQGAVYLTGSPQRTDVPADNVDLEVRKVDGMPFSDVESFEEWIQDALDEALNETTAELEALFGEHLDEMDQGDLEDLHEQYSELVEQNEELQEELDELSDDPSDEELKEELEAIEEALSELEEDIEADEPETEIEDDLLSYEVEFDADIDEDAVAATVVYEDGETESVDEEYISVSSAGLFGDSTTVAIEDYPIAEDKAVADVRVQVATEDGYGESRDQIINPAFEDDIPALDAIDVSTDRPGPNERVGLSVRPEDGTGYGALADVRAYNPDGEQTDVEIDGERARIQMDGEGVHRIEVEYENQQGDVFREVIQLRAQDASTTTGPTVRATQGPSGMYAVAGEGLDSAAVEIRDVDEAVGITAIAPGGEEPNELHVYPDAALSGSTDQLDVRVLKGDREEAVHRHVSLVIHTERLDSDTILWRGGDPITHDGDTRYGEVDERQDGDKHVIYTYTDERGSVEITARHDPGFIDRATHRIAVTSPVGLPFLTTLPLPATAGLTVFATGLTGTLVARRVLE